MSSSSRVLLFFFNDTATTEIYTLSLHDALPISHRSQDLLILVSSAASYGRETPYLPVIDLLTRIDRKSTRLNSSHVRISYAVFCLKKKNKKTDIIDLYVLSPFY